MDLISLIADQELAAPVVVLEGCDSLVADHGAVEYRVQTVASKESADGLVHHGRVEAFATDGANRKHTSVIESNDAIKASANDVIRYHGVDCQAF